MNAWRDGLKKKNDMVHSTFKSLVEKRLDYFRKTFVDNMEIQKIMFYNLLSTLLSTNWRSRGVPERQSRYSHVLRFHLFVVGMLGGRGIVIEQRFVLNIIIVITHGVVVITCNLS